MVRIPVGVKLGGLLALVLGVTALVLLVAIDRNEARDLEVLMHKQARQIFRQIVIARDWNAAYGGVYVERKEGVEVNRFLPHMGPGQIQPELFTDDGREFILKPPALMAQELSFMSNQAGLVNYTLTSLNPINKDNAADDFEAEWLRRFQNGAAEEGGAMFADQGVYRYIAPLKVSESCLRCHGYQGYRVGDVRGGVSVTLPMTEEQAIVAQNRTRLRWGGGILAVLLVTALVWMSRSIITRPVADLRAFAVGRMGQGGGVPGYLLKRRDEVGELARTMDNASVEISRYRTKLEALVEERTIELREARDQLDQLSRTDPLTGLNNRRHLALEAPKMIALSQRDGKPTGFILADIDHFKRFNDVYGHDVGDLTLAHVAELFRANARPYDLAVRWGGEEFLIVLPSCDGLGALAVAERIRTAIEASPVKAGDKTITITASFGVYTESDMDTDEESIEDAVRRADQALYRAKETGRNCSVPWTPELSETGT